MRDFTKLILEAVTPPDTIVHYHDGLNSHLTGPDGRTHSTPVKHYENQHDDHMAAHDFLKSYPADTPIVTNTLSKHKTAGDMVAFHAAKAAQHADFDVVSTIKDAMEKHGFDHSKLDIQAGGRGHVHGPLGQSQTVNISAPRTDNHAEHGLLHDEHFKKALASEGHKYTRGSYAGNSEGSKWSFDVWHKNQT